MKSEFIFLLLTFGTLICATYSTPSRSQTQEDDDLTSEQDLLRLLETITKSKIQDEDSTHKDHATKSQQYDYPYVEEQLFGKRGRRVRGYIKQRGRGIMKGAGRFAGKAINGAKGFFKQHGRGIMKGAGRLVGGALSGLLNGGGGMMLGPGNDYDYETTNRQEEASEIQQNGDQPSEEEHLRSQQDGEDLKTAKIQRYRARSRRFRGPSSFSRRNKGSGGGGGGFFSTIKNLFSSLYETANLQDIISNSS